MGGIEGLPTNSNIPQEQAVTSKDVELSPGDLQLIESKKVCFQLQEAAEGVGGGAYFSPENVQTGERTAIVDTEDGNTHNLVLKEASTVTQEDVPGMEGVKCCDVEIDGTTHKAMIHGTVTIDGKTYVAMDNVKDNLIKAENRAVLKQVESGKATVTDSNAVGGHGGFKDTKVTIDGKDHFLFLKPFDQVEHDNCVHYIPRYAPELGDEMPRVYGKAFVDGKPFLVMESLGEVITEAKASSVEEGIANPIVSQGEIKATRNKQKGAFDAAQMLVGAKTAPGFMVPQQSFSLKIGKTDIGKATRIFNYGRSDKTLLEKTKNLETEAASQDLTRIARKIGSSNVGLVGISAMFYKERETGQVRAKISDFAHIEVRPGMGAPVPGAKTPAFAPTDEEFKARQASNQHSFVRMATTLFAQKPLNTKIPPAKPPNVSKGWTSSLPKLI